MEKEFGSIVEEFKPGLFGNLRGCSVNIFKSIVDHAIDSKVIYLDITTFDKSSNIGLWIYNEVLGLDVLTSHLTELVEFDESLKNLSEKLVMMSYT